MRLPLDLHTDVLMIICYVSSLRVIVLPVSVKFYPHSFNRGPQTLDQWLVIFHSFNFFKTDRNVSKAFAALRQLKG